MSLIVKSGCEESSDTLVENANGEGVGTSDTLGITGNKGLDVHATIAKINRKRTIRTLEIRMGLVKSFIYCALNSMRADGVRYTRVGGTRQRYFDGTNLKPRKVLENAATPTSRVQAALIKLYTLLNLPQ